MALIGSWRHYNAIEAGGNVVLPDLSDEGTSVVFGTTTLAAVTENVDGQCALRVECNERANAEPADPDLYAPTTLTIVARVAFMDAAFDCNSGVEPGTSAPNFGAYQGIVAYNQGGYPLIAPSIKWVFFYDATLNQLGLLMNDGTVGVGYGAGTFVYSDTLPITPAASTMYSVGVRFGPDGDPADFFWEGAAVGGGTTPFDLMTIPYTATPSPPPAPPRLAFGDGGEVYAASDVAIAALRLWNVSLADAAIAAAMTEDALIPECGEPFPVPEVSAAAAADRDCVVTPVCPEEEEAGVVALSATRVLGAWQAGRGPLRLRTRRRGPG